MQHQNFVLIAVAIFSLLLGAIGYQMFLPEAPYSRGSRGTPGRNLLETLAAIPLTDIDGQRSLIGQRSEDLLVVNFWAPWCAPCRREIPALIDIHEQFSSQG